MTDLEDLEEISDSIGFVAYAGWGVPAQGSRRPTDVCGAGHPWTPESTRTYRQKGRERRVCRICDKNRATMRRKAKRDVD